MKKMSVVGGAALFASAALAQSVGDDLAPVGDSPQLRQAVGAVAAALAEETIAAATTVAPIVFDDAIDDRASDAVRDQDLGAEARLLPLLGLQVAGHGTVMDLAARAMADPGETLPNPFASIIKGRFCRLICAGSSPLNSCSEEPAALATAVAPASEREFCEPHHIPVLADWDGVIGGNRLAGTGGIYQDSLQPNPNIPSGYTFLGQFIDHDMTATLVALGLVPAALDGEMANAEAVAELAKVGAEMSMEPLMDPVTRNRREFLEEANGRTADLDLDSVYGTYGSYGQIVDSLLMGDDPIAANVFEILPSGLPSGRFRLAAVRTSGGYDMAPEYAPAPDEGETLAPDAPEPGTLVNERTPREAVTGLDLPRRIDGSAYIVDPRNDENKIISGLHTMMELAHNDCVDFYTQRAFSGRAVRVGPNSGERLSSRLAYDLCRAQVPLVYQTIVLTDYLPRTLDPSFATVLLGENGSDSTAAVLSSADAVRSAIKVYRASPSGVARVPESFGVAAFRLGHSQLRPGYRLQPETFNNEGDRVAGERRALFDASAENRDLSGRRSMTPRDVVDWSVFFDVGGEVQPSMLIDLILPPAVGTMPVVALPPEPIDVVNGQVQFRTDTRDEQNLARRNILRGASTTVRPAGSSGPELPFPGIALPGAEDFVGVVIPYHAKPGESYDAERVYDLIETTLSPPEAASTPLWLYVLAEAQEMNGGTRLGRLGSILVGETIAGIIAFDEDSVLNVDLDALSTQFVWEPLRTVADNRRFAMPDLIGHLQSKVCLSTDDGGPVRLTSVSGQPVQTCS